MLQAYSPSTLGVTCADELPVGRELAASHLALMARKHLQSETEDREFILGHGGRQVA